MLRRSAVVALVAAFLLLASGAAQQKLPRDALWEIVHDVCVPGQTLRGNPAPCARVDLAAGAEKGFAILKDPRDTSQFLLIPTGRVSGIESPALLDPGAPNYFASAWEARRYVLETLGKTLSRDDLGLVVNSKDTRSQDQLHIHVDCVKAAVRDGLHHNEDRISGDWSNFPMPLSQQLYMARWVPGEDLGTTNPFHLLADGVPGAARDMGDHTLIVVGFTRMDGARGFVLLTNRVETVPGSQAYGEELLDHACRIAAQ
jgi:CDP-diacylglycerol pyrophosphatase